MRLKNYFIVFVFTLFIILMVFLFNNINNKKFSKTSIVKEVEVKKNEDSHNEELLRNSNFQELDKVNRKKFAKLLVIQKAEKKVPELKKILSSKVIIDSVIKENNKNKSLDMIKELDNKWINSIGTPEFIKPFLENECAIFLKENKKRFTYIAEMFVMDNKGAIVCITDKTTDYWQGDESKWKKSFNNGAGKIFIDHPKFDESTRDFLIQISFPIYNFSNNQKETIGAATFGIDLDKLK